MRNLTDNLTTTRYIMSGAILGVSLFSLISNFVALNINADTVDVLGGSVGAISVLAAKLRHLF